MRSPLDEAREEFEQAQKQGGDVAAKAVEYLDVACRLRFRRMLDNEGLLSVIKEVRPYTTTWCWCEAGFWWAWRPVRTVDGEWVWLDWVKTRPGRASAEYRSLRSLHRGGDA